jgi:hypothetical protein
MDIYPTGERGVNVLARVKASGRKPELVHFQNLVVPLAVELQCSSIIVVHSIAQVLESYTNTMIYRHIKSSGSKEVNR